jgi:hypothetical protein
MVPIVGKGEKKKTEGPRLVQFWSSAITVCEVFYFRRAIAVCGVDACSGFYLRL